MNPNEIDKRLLELFKEFSESKTWWEPGDFSLAKFWTWLKIKNENES